MWRPEQAKSKLVLNFYQVVACIPSVYNVSLPDGKYAAWVLSVN